MRARRLKGVVTPGGEIVLREPNDLPPGEVDVIVLYPEPSPRRRRRSAGSHPAFGIWADRPEAQDPMALAASLRDGIEARHDRRD